VIRCDQTGGDDASVEIDFDVVTNNHVLVLPPQNWTSPAR
jgi:hypothetical protein